MKQVLSLLTAFLFLQMQTWALSGGPVFSPQSSPNQAGTYSGIFVPKETTFNFDPVSPLADTNGLEPVRDTAGKIGVFTVSVPVTGGATGTTILFLNGAIFTGTIDGVADPDRGTFDGIIQLTSSFDIILQQAQTIVIPAQPGPPVVPAQIVNIPAITVTPLAQGQMNCKIIEASRTPQAGRTDTSLGNAARMKGDANVDSFVFVELTGRPIPIVQVRYKVVGYRQNTTPLP